MEGYEASNGNGNAYDSASLNYGSTTAAAGGGSIGNRQVNGGDSSSSYHQHTSNGVNGSTQSYTDSYNQNRQPLSNSNTHSSAPSTSYSYSDHPTHLHPHQQQKQQHHYPQQQDGGYQSSHHQTSSYSNNQYSAPPGSSASNAANTGNVNNSLQSSDYQRHQPQHQHHQHQPNNNYSYSNNTSNTMGTDMASTSNTNTSSYPHQQPHPSHPAESNYSEGTQQQPLQPQAPSSTTQSSSSNHQQRQSEQAQQNFYPSSTSNGQAQPPQVSARQRTISGGFETVKAGPPTEGKTDLLPFPHNQNSSSHGRDHSSSRHRSRNSQSSFQVHHPQPQKPSSQYSQITAQTPSANKEPYHEPVAPSSGRSANSKGSSTTSEFTKRKNWSQRIVEEMQDILHVLAPDGTVLFVSPSLYDLCGITPEEMVGKMITEFMEPFDVDHFNEEFRNSIMTESSMTTYYRLKKRNNSDGHGPRVNSSGGLAGLGNLKEEESDDSSPLNQPNDLSNAAAEAIAAINLKSDTLLLEVTGQPYYTTSPDGVKPKKGSGSRRKKDDGNAENEDEDTNMGESGNSGSSSSSSSNPHTHKSNHKSRNSLGSATGGSSKTCKCFFAMARPYPSRNNATLDTFLELKIENENLRTKLANIYREIEGDESGTTTQTKTDYSGMGRTHADNGSGFQLSSGDSSQKNQPPYFGADPMAIDTFNPHERQISGFPSRLTGAFASQQAQSGGDQSMKGAYSRTDSGMDGQTKIGDDGHSLASGRHPPGVRGGPIDQGDGLISSAGLIPSTSNTYGALGIGISASARANANSSSHAANDDTGASATGNLSSINNASNAAGQAAMASAAAAEDKKKKMKKQRTDEGEFVCRDCGTVDSPEWRRGPLGPKTLCNACGLRWAKKNKQQQRNSIGGNESITLTK
ncbi:hypothetical protein P389DRAFT_172287 [Cystobasidium minutum MCA 4210]|uniref:uncharacterized protein n=1 Tax=Cystobasidium minutum MCA 4210 TaxID=1397322 RepID=UPI0034CFB7A8|eukprot:jgi/Rhomi1/172287/fgenesh1_kg.4_\